MAKPPRDQSLSNSRTYFVTARSWEGRAIFQSARIADLFMHTVFGYRAQGKYEIHEFVVMRNHFHALLTLAPDVTLERAMQLIQGWILS